MVGGGESDNGRKGEGKLGWWNLQGVKMQKKGKNMESKWRNEYLLFKYSLNIRLHIKLKGFEKTSFYLTSSTFM